MSGGCVRGRIASSSAPPIGVGWACLPPTPPLEPTLVVHPCRHTSVREREREREQKPWPFFTSRARAILQSPLSQFFARHVRWMLDVANLSSLCLVTYIWEGG